MAALRMKLSGAKLNPEVAGLEALPGQVNYFIGNDPPQWRTNIATYASVRYREVYPGIDLVYYGQQRQPEYDFIVAPGASYAPVYDLPVPGDYDGDGGCDVAVWRAPAAKWDVRQSNDNVIRIQSYATGGRYVCGVATFAPTRSA